MHNIETKKGNNLLPQINNGEKMVALISLASLFCGK
jgi:hypothetical protein